MKVTIYVKSDLFGNIVKREGVLISAEAGVKYAQYNNAVKVVYRGKRKRSNTGFVQTYMPYVVIVEGWDRPDPKELCDVTVSNENGVTVKKSSYASFDKRFCTDFDELVDGGKLGKVVFEARHTKGYNPHSQF